MEVASGLFGMEFSLVQEACRAEKGYEVYVEGGLFFQSFCRGEEKPEQFVFS